MAFRRWACLDAVAGAFLVVSDVCEWDARAALKNPSAIFRGLDLSVGKKMADLATLPKVWWTGNTVNSKSLPNYEQSYHFKNMVGWSEALEVRRRIIGETERWFVLIPLRERLKP